MSLRALKFIHGDTSIGPFQCSLEPSPEAAFAKLKAQGMYAAYVVRERDLEDFRKADREGSGKSDLEGLGKTDLERSKSGELFVDRGRKHAAKALADLLLGQKKIPFINGGYATTGRLEQGVAALLKKAAKENDRNLYIIGASGEIFDELWKAADPKSRSMRAKKKAGRAKYEARHGTKDESAHGTANRTAHGTGYAIGREIERGSRRNARYETGLKPNDSERVEDLMSSQVLLELLPEEDIPEELSSTYLGTSLQAQLVRRFIMRAASDDRPVLIIGDTGTGKEVVAQSIHNYSPRKRNRFIPLNCGAIPQDLLESELFGAVKGVATGLDAHIGLWEQASYGTLFLDEIGELTAPHQVKILRALEEKKIRRVGEATERDAPARIVAATNQDLFALVRTGRFREDLYYRLRSFTIPTPTLRNHPEDIAILAQAIWRKITHEEIANLPNEIVLKLQAYRWPGNVRELRAVLLNVHTLFGSDGLGEEHLEAVFQLEGHGKMRSDESTPESDLVLHRVECLRHLRRVDEVVRACKVTLRPIIEEKQTDHETIESVASVLRRRLGELELLCLRPLLFNTEVTFSVVHSLKGQLTDLRGLLLDDARRALGYWKSEVADEFKLTLTAVFQEVERLTARA